MCSSDLGQRILGTPLPTTGAFISLKVQPPDFATGQAHVIHHTLGLMVRREKGSGILVSGGRFVPQVQGDARPVENSSDEGVGCRLGEVEPNTMSPMAYIRNEKGMRNSK